MNFDFKRMLKFEHNVGTKEKQYRLYAGAAIATLSVFMGNIALLVIGVALIASGFSGWCPVYSGMNKNTCEATSGQPEASGTSDSEKSE